MRIFTGQNTGTRLRSDEEQGRKTDGVYEIPTFDWIKTREYVQGRKIKNITNKNNLLGKTYPNTSAVNK